MSSTQSETNGELRRDNFTMHEEGTLANSEFTHPQMPIAQSILNQPKMKHKRNQACKPHNVAKFASQKEKKRNLKAKIPDNVYWRSSDVQAHCLLLLKVRYKDFSSLPAPPSTEGHEIVIQVSSHLGYVPGDVFNEPSKQVQYQGFQSYFKNELHKLELKRFTRDWESLWEHPLSKLISMVFYHNFHLTLVNTEYHYYYCNKDHNNYGVVVALMEWHFTYFKRE
ncbi:hypothetical protein O181_113920 [Austropuccinia psidii MF-1]|uniref:Uncharacterized protein n=1 Tax=Austropuccinia psidii MF-1 TaxID=1389203 RepID=A0A9Q3PV08_9BASI|nr:hypothetical protein [Austropuccinia psidii MF-1]